MKGKIFLGKLDIWATKMHNRGLLYFRQNVKQITVGWTMLIIAVLLAILIRSFGLFLIIFIIAAHVIGLIDELAT